MQGGGRGFNTSTAADIQNMQHSKAFKTDHNQGPQTLGRSKGQTNCTEGHVNPKSVM